MVFNTPYECPIIKGPSGSNPHPSSPPIAILNTILVEESFPERLLLAQFDIKNHVMHKSTQFSWFDDPHSCIINNLSLVLLARQVYLEAHL